MRNYLRKNGLRFNGKRFLGNMSKALGFILFAVIFVQAIAHAPKSPTQQWHDAIEEGMTWNEYVNQNK